MTYSTMQKHNNHTPLMDAAGYKAAYADSIQHPDAFWLKQAERIDWFNAPSKAGDYAFSKEDVSIAWYEDGTLNACYNCVDRHLPARANDTAIIWEGDDPNDSKHITYAELHQQVCKLANGLEALGVQKGDVVTIYMPMIPEAAYAMLACARIGAVHSVVFGGFSPEALRGRMEDCESRFIITADEGVRGGKTVPLKANVDAAVTALADVTSLVVKRTGADVAWHAHDNWYHELVDTQPETHSPAEMEAEAPLFVLYTSGSTGKPKGVQHSTGGYMVYTSLTHELTFDYRPGDIYWCTADVGWITGHSYILYGPLANGATTVMFEGVPTYPSASRCWEVVEKHKVNMFYTAPTAIRALMALGDEMVTNDRSSLRILGTVGEPINPEAWRWYHEVVGQKRCPIVDTWWQTETGGFLITPLPYATTLKPGAASMPFLGIEPVIVDNDGNVLEGAAEGNLCMKGSWPAQARTVRGDHTRFIETYFSQFDGYYFTGDGAKRDADGYYWITGRVDDVLNISGHRLGTAEVESALVLHEQVAEAAVVGSPHDIKGEAIYAFVTLNAGIEADEALQKELVQLVRKEIGPIASPDYIQFAPGLPKTRSGKIMRRILRKIACNDYGNLGDTKTLLNPEVVDVLIKGRLVR